MYTARGSTNGGTRSFFRKKFALTLHLARKETWSDFNIEFGIVHLNIKLSKIPHSLLPDSARFTPKHKTDGSTPILIVKTHYSLSFSNHVKAETR
jgi:hypothetical protein